MKKIQVLSIHGGMTFRNTKDYLKCLDNRNVYIEDKVSWSGKYFTEKLGNKFQVIKPQMPLKDDAKYRDWKIIFEKYISHLDKDFILVGRSLGGIFLAKYLSENVLPHKALSVYLIAPPFDNTLKGEDLVSGFKLKNDLSLINENTENLNLMFSKDDECIPVSHAEKYRKKLPNAKITIYKSKNGHFQISKFPEIIKAIKKDSGVK